MKHKFPQWLLGGLLLGALGCASAEPHDIQLNNHGGSGDHVRQFNSTGGHQNFRNVNDGAHLNNERFNNDTVNVNRGPYNNGRYGAPYNNNYYPPYRGWNEGPVGWNNGWNSGWNNGENNGGWGVGLMEGIIGGIAATALFNELFNHNSTPSVAYVNGGGSSGGSDGGNSSFNSDGQPTPETINNTTNTVVNEDDGSSIGYWLLGAGILVLAGLGIWYSRRRQKRYSDEEYYEDQPRYHQHEQHRYQEDYDNGYDEPQPRHLAGRSSREHLDQNIPHETRKRPVRHQLICISIFYEL